MAKVKVINKRQGSDLVGANFRNIASETVFSFGRFTVDTNFGVRRVRNYSNTLSSFVKPITLETLNISDEESEIIYNNTQEVVLNFDKSDLTSYARFGSLKDLLRVSVENIILQFPASIRVSHQISTFTTADSVTNYSYDDSLNTSTFTIPYNTLVNKFGLVLNSSNMQLPQDQALRNLNISFNEYVVWRESEPTNNNFEIIGFTGFSNSQQYINVIVNGDPFPELSSGGTTSGKFNYHLKPRPLHFNKFKTNLSRLESYLLNEKIAKGYRTEFQTPVPLDDGGVTYSDQEIIWSASDGYNVDIDGYQYNVFLNDLGSIGSLYDQFKSDLLLRMLVPESLVEGDETESQKMTKLLRVYGRSFDNIKLYIDALVTINKLSYNKKKNIPDLLVKNLAKTMGWDAVTLVNDDDLLNSFFSTEERAVNDLLPPEVDVELWRRILLNTNYLFKAKGTRDAIKTMLLMVGIPEPFINITEYIYTVDEKINPNTVTVSLADLPSASLPYNSEGYPTAPKETKTFYFQVSGNTDSGQQYMDVFRNVGFTLNRTVDNKKSWVQSGTTERRHYTTPNYYQNDSKLVLNTKEIDVTLDISRGIEFDVWNYNLEHNFPITTSGVTKPHLYINIPFTYGTSASSFTVPEIPQGDIQVSFNGLTLVKGSGATDPSADYYINPLNEKEVILIGGVAQTYSNGHKDVISLTYVKDKTTGGTYNLVDYVVTKISATVDGLSIPLLETPLGEVQLVVNGITLTKGTSLYTGDYVISGDELIVVNNDLKNYLINNPVVAISYIKSSTNDPILKKSEVYRIDSFSASKFFYNSGINKYVYVLDYEPPTVNAVKIVVNGLTLQNGTDFTLNSANRKQVLFNTTALNLGFIINAFYVVADGNTDTGIDFGDFEFPNLSEISFLEYLELINRRLINVKNRKTLTDHEGGLYPTVQKLYEEYLKRSNAVSPIPASNGYTFTSIYPFINKFNSFFHRFIDQLLSATIILKKGGVLVRNTAFTKQKFPYRRGVSFDQSLNHLGNDGSEFVKRIQETAFSFAWDDIICVSENYVINEYNILMTEVSRTTTTGGTYLDVFQNTIVEYKMEIEPELSNGAIFTFDYNLTQDGTINGSADFTNTFQIIKNGVTAFTNTITAGSDIVDDSFTMISSDDVRLKVTINAHSPNTTDTSETSINLNIHTVTSTESGALINAPLPFTIIESVETPEVSLADGVNWTLRTNPVNAKWSSIAFGNNMFVAVAETSTGNKVMTSPDGINWTMRVEAANNNWNSVTYGENVGLFVAVASSGVGNRIMTSPDGITWTSRTSAADKQWWQITYGDGLFVVVGSGADTNLIMTSPDAITWTLRTAPDNLSWRSVTYGAGLFVAVAGTGSGNRVMTSPDGITWTSRTSADDNPWLGVTYGNGLFVAVAATGSGRVMTSPDGINWTLRTSAIETHAWVSVTFGNGVFAAIAYTGTGQRIMTSTDGITWTSRTTPAGADSIWECITFGNNTFVAVSNTGYPNQVLTSP